MTDLLTVMATPAWAYLALFGFLAVDAMVPVVPIQAIMITSGALTVYGNLSLPLVIAYGGGAALAWATYGGLVGHIGGTAVTQSAWRLFAIAATAAVIFGTAGWILALFGGRKTADRGYKKPAAQAPATGA